jgi:2-polyprenyl-3-methyl-5-hydroxy-6-metoxy-1,4-benzoquinol methylase
MENEQAPVFKEHEIEWDDKKVSRLWDYYSRTSPYSEIYFSKLFGHHILRQSGLPLAEPLKVLDFGCGPGFIWDHLQRIGANWQYTALDFSPDSVKKLVEKATGNENFKSVQHVSSLPTELPESHFDVILLFEVVEHLNDVYLVSTLAEIARLLKQGGVVVISTPNEEDLSISQKFCPECGAVFHEYQHVRNWSVGGLTTCLKPYGFNLRIAKTLDFTTQDLTVKGLFRKAKRIARRLLKGDPGTPHMVAVFQKA